MGLAHAILAAQAADAIVGFLYDIHTEEQSATDTDSPFGRNSDFDEYLDDQYEGCQHPGSSSIPQ